MAMRWKAIGPHFGRFMANDIPEEVVNSYIALRRSQGRGEGTILVELKTLRAALKFAVQRDLIGKAPYIRAPSAPPPRDKRLTRAEAQRLIASCSIPHVKLFVILALTTGARLQAILSLTWERIDFEAGMIDMVDPEHTGKRRVLLPMNATARAALTEAHRASTCDFVIEWGSKRIRDIRDGLNSAARRAGIQAVNPHMLRHSAASWLAEAGTPMPEIARFLGHGDSRVTERVYARLSPTYMRKTVSALEL
jgi:integrase